jgi:hypothetical protein
MRGAGFTLEVQHFGEGFSRGPKVKALSRRVVVGPDEGIESFGRQLCEVGLARQEAAHAADGILDAALLPRGIGIAEECLDRQAMQLVMMSELGSVVEGDGLPQSPRQTCEQLGDPPRDRPSRLVGAPAGQDDPRLALVHGEHRLAVFGKHHQVGFPMAVGLATGCGGRPFCYGNAAFDEACRAPTVAAAEAASALAARQIIAPAIVFGAGDLGVDEAVDALVADDLVPGFAGQPSGDLLGGPATGQAIEHGAAQGGIAFQAASHPAPRPRLLVSVTGFVAHLAAAIAVQLTRDCRWRAIQSCRDLPDRGSIGSKAGNLAPLVQ